jgi:hypothetical protein
MENCPLQEIIDRQGTYNLYEKALSGGKLWIGR